MRGLDDFSRFARRRFRGNRTCDFEDQQETMAAPVEERISVPIDDPNADTEWYLPRFKIYIG
jgi:hypothetical protein